jgi:biotin carboxyl carrier protein
MKTVCFKELVSMLGIGTAVVIFEKALPEKFFSELNIEDWFAICREAEPGSELKGRALTTIKEIVRWEIKSPLVGTFTQSGVWPCGVDAANPLVKVGDRVEPNTIVCGIEAMMVQNSIKADVRGTITEVEVKHGDAVGYGDVLFRIKPEL